MAMRKCSICKNSYDKTKLFFVGLKCYCSAECGAILGLELHTKQSNERLKADKRELKIRKDKLNDTVRNWTKKTQAECNKFIRMRDINEPCISCNKSREEIESGPPRVGGYWDAGHYLSRGASPELRFEVMNIHKQCKSCNGGSIRSSKSKTVSAKYKERLIKKIGQDNVDWIEGPHEPKHYRVEDLKLLHTHFKRLIKQLES